MTRDEQSWLVIAALYVATLDFLGGLSFKY